MDALPSKVQDVVARRRRNSILPINQLPLEIFPEIIFLVLQDVRNTTRYYDRLRKLRMVSFGWATLIDGNSTFWNYVNAFSPENTWRMAFRKSKSSKLDVDCLSPSRDLQLPPELFRAEVAACMERVRSLRIKEIDFRYLSIESSVAVCLEDICVEGVGWQEAWLAHGILSRGWADTWITWLGPASGTLKSIAIDDGSSGRTISTLHLLSILAASPQLRHLFLKVRVDGEQDDKNPVLPCVQLTELETFHCSTFSSKNISRLFDSITSRPKKMFSLRMSAESDIVQPGNLRNLGRFCPTAVEAETMLQLHTGRFSVPTISVGGFHVELDSDMDFGLELFGFGTVGTDPLIHILQGVPSSVCQSVVTVEWNSGMANVERAGILLPLFHERFPNTRRLRLGLCGRSEVALLGEPITNAPWLFPKLEALSLSSLEAGGVLDVVRSRLQAVDGGASITRLTKLELELGYRHRDDKERIRELRELLPNVLIKSLLAYML